jgi:hypothetical protein
MPAAIEGTYKARDVEGLLDLYFYRLVGFALAQFFARLGITPVGVTALSGVFGIAAGHLYYYRDLRVNILGMVLHVISNTLDNADGQLARLTNQGSRNGRIIDSISDHLIFVGIYLHLTLRCLAESASPAIWLLALAAGLSHGVQGAVADYYRNAYLFFVTGRARAEFDSSTALRLDYERCSWRREPRQKFLLRVYLNFTLGQEKFSPNLMQLRSAALAAFPSTVPESLARRYGTIAKPLFNWIGLLMTNTRMLILFMVLILDRPAWYFIAELTALNLVLVYVLFKQSQLCRLFLPEIRMTD